MKNKKLLYVLIPGTLLVWGMILYKIFHNMHATETAVFQRTETIMTTDKITNDTFSIHPDYRDPFLGKKAKRDDHGNGQVAKPVVVKPVKEIAVMPWPKIIYGGIIKNQKSNKQLALIQINGQSNMMKTGEEASGVQLLRIFRDSIEVKFLKEKKFISKF